MSTPELAIKSLNSLLSIYFGFFLASFEALERWNLEPLKISLELDKIPIYEGVKELLDEGFESTLSPSNKIFLKNIEGVQNLRFELIYNDFQLNDSLYKTMLKVLVDPQTCGPLVISCSPVDSEKLIKNGPWKKIGFISS